MGIMLFVHTQTNVKRQQVTIRNILLHQVLSKVKVLKIFGGSGYLTSL